MNTISLNSDLWGWLARQANGKRVKEYQVVPGDSKPTWHYEKGWTKWKNGRPKKYTRCESLVTVGEDWLSARFPVAWATMRLSGQWHLHVTGDDIVQAERISLDLERWARASAQTEHTWNIVQSLKGCRTIDPENERLYA